MLWVELNKIRIFDFCVVLLCAHIFAPCALLHVTFIFNNV
jgi:hypothetical protein